MKRRQVVRDASSGPAQQQQAAAAVATQQALGGTVEMQPNIAAPVLRTDKDRREWLQKELELCNMSSEFRKVIDGELAQRAEASRKLKVGWVGRQYDQGAADSSWERALCEVAGA